MVPRLISMVVVAALVSVHAAAAQEGALSKLYGRGVHSYFDGNYSAASRSLSQAIESGSEDPRCFYFRGLAHMRLGKTADARADFKQGARLESRASERYYDVNRALERVQGRTRLTVEHFRTDGRVAAASAARRIRQLRYDQIHENEAEVLRRPLPDTLDGTSAGGGGDDTPPLEVDVSPLIDLAPPVDTIDPAASGDSPFGAESGPDGLLPPPPDTLDAPPPFSPDATDAGGGSDAAAEIEGIDTSGADVPAEKIQGVLTRALLKVLGGGDSGAPGADAPFDFPSGDDPDPIDIPPTGEGDPFDLGDNSVDNTDDADMPDDLSDPENPFGDSAVVDDGSGDIPDLDQPPPPEQPAPPDGAGEPADEDNPFEAGDDDTDDAPIDPFADG